MDSKQVLISVILPTYNRAKWLKETSIPSVLAQTYKNWELLVSDDGSTDNTEEVVKSFKDPRIKYFKFPQSGGFLGMARNRVIKKAKGELFAFIDSDVAYRKDHLQALYKELERYPDLAFVYGDRVMMDPEGKKPHVTGVYGEWDPVKLGGSNYIDTSDVLIRKEPLLAVGGWAEDVLKFADWELWVRLSKAGYNAKRLQMILTEYYVHENMNQLKHTEDKAPFPNSPAFWFDPSACFWHSGALSKRPEPKVAIFTIIWNRLDYLEKTHKSIQKTTKYPFDWFVVDNGSVDGSLAYAEKYAHKIIKNKTNVGISEASNQALDAIGDKYDIIMKVDNDAEFLTEGWLEAIVDIWKRNKNLVVSPRVEGLIDNPGGVPRTRYSYCGRHYIGITIHLGGITIAADKSAYDGFRWDKSDFLHGEQDIIFSQHCRQKHYTLAYLEDYAVEHLGVMGNQDKEYEEQWKKSKTTRNKT